MFIDQISNFDPLPMSERICLKIDNLPFVQVENDDEEITFNWS
jgi:hypothetical protein